MGPRAARLAVLLAALLPALPSLWGGFLYDDASFLEEGVRAQAFRARYLPLLTLKADLALWGASHPAGFHATNLLLHAAAALAALAAARRLAPGAALPAALLFAVHPLQTSASCYVVQRAEILAALFSLLALAAWLDGRWLAAAGAALGALLSKDSAAALPLLLGAAELLFRRRRAALKFLALLAAGTAALVLFHFQRIPLSWTYAASQPRSILRYLASAFLPWGLRIEYGWDPLPAPGSLAVLAGAAALAWRRPAWRFALLWFLGSLLPTSSLVPLEDPVMDHRPYAALFGLCVAVGGLPLRRLLPVLALLATLTAWRAGTWASEEALWRGAARLSPRADRAWEGLGNARRDGERALARALRLFPRNHKAAHNLGRRLAARGDHAGAVPLFRQAIASMPGQADASLDLSVSLWRLGRDAEAVPVLEAAEAAHPEYAMIPFNLGCTLGRLGRFREAVPPLERAVRLCEDPATPQRNPPENPRRALEYAKRRASAGP